MGSAREVNVKMAKLAEQAELYDDMAEYMEKVVALGGELNTQERQIFARSFYHAVGARRKAWQIVSTAESSKEVRSDFDLARAVKECKNKIELDLLSYANRCLPQLLNKCIPNACTVAEKCFYSKLQGDHYRYLADIRTGEDRELSRINAICLYRNCQKMTASELPDITPAMAHLELTYALFMYEILESKRPESTPRTGDVSMLVKKLQDELMSWSTYEEQE
ncbi:hypothetical protein V2J09_018515 [Rumex salicifolius]